jgi:acyl carrier protein
VDATKTTIREVLAEHAKLSVEIERLADDDDLFEAGLTSLSTVTVMLALEDAFETEFPESMLSRRTFTSVETIHDALGELLYVS